MTPREIEEYTELRSTIRERSTTRIWVFAAGIAAWAALDIATAVLLSTPLDTLLPLLVLAATFEAVFALHVGVERIGRYLQVFHEAPGEQAAWETVAMSFGAPAAGTGLDPLFAIIFGVAAGLNFLPVMLIAPAASEVVVIGALHALFLARLIRARAAAARQRAADLARFQQMRASAFQSPGSSSVRRKPDATIEDA
ncbi:MAG: hypothetical protein IT176_07330 [Acidobacteria bacterium]|nr:hypothetical protein [Acidobacteriota bacterium]